MLRTNVFALLAGFLVTNLAWSQRPAVRITGPISNSQLRTLGGNVHPLAQPQFEQGSAPPDLPMERMLLVLSRTAAQEADLQNLLQAQQNPASPQYHHWLTPQEFGARYGAAEADIQTITTWLQSQGFTVNSVSNGKTIVEFSGTALQVEQAFHTEIHKYVVNGQEHWANSTNPQIPQALTTAVVGVATLHNFTKQTQLTNSGRTFEAMLSAQGRPQFTSSSGGYALSPGDYAIIYNLNPLFAAGINGTGRTIGVVARTNINLTRDITGTNGFRPTFGITTGSVQVIVNGRNPGDLGGDEEAEAVLDTSWAGATAPGATIDVVVSRTTNTTDGVDLSEAYIIDQNLTDVMTESFGDCEANYTQSEAAMYSSLAQQAAAQGITYLVAAGDAGAAGCNSGSDTTYDGTISVNILSSNPYVVAVGGTEFNENGNYGLYWSSTNSSTDVSVLSYIPEDVWNESCTSSAGVNPCTNGNTPGLWSGGGGASTLYSKPSWQTGVTGIPNDGARDVPDVSLTAAGHDPYLLCLDGSCTPNSRGRISFQGYSGTSAATPSMAGIVTTIAQQAGGRLGLINPSLYQLAAVENLGACNASNVNGLPAGNCIFNDVTVGNNSVPGMTNYPNGQYAATVGYDLATGLGSVNAANLSAGLTGAATGTPVLQLSPSALAFSNVNVGSTATQQVTVSNAGSGNLSISQISITGGSTQFSVSSDCGTMILPNQSCAVTVTFAPTSSGAQTASLSVVTSNAGSGSVALSGTGVTPLISETTLSFGTQKVGTFSVQLMGSSSQSLVITNTTGAALRVNSISITGTNAADFTQTNNCPSSLAVNATCTISVSFIPQAAGSRLANLNISDSAPGSPQTVSLHGTGIAGPNAFAVWRPTNGTWYVLNENATSQYPNPSIAQQWGLTGDVPVVGDYDGDGQTDFAVWRPSTGTWFVLYRTAVGQYPIASAIRQWGLPGDIPVPGDYDGDGKTDFAVWRPSTGTWYIIPSSNPGTPITQQWGLAGDIPVAGDFDGDGKTDLAVWRPSNGTWYIIPSSNSGSPITQQWGLSGDTPVVGDFNNDGKADFAVWRPSNGTWYVLYSTATAQYPNPSIQQQWGLTGDTPLVGDFNGDGQIDFTVWRTSSQIWYSLFSNATSQYPNPSIAQQWGVLADTPVIFR